MAPQINLEIELKDLIDDTRCFFYKQENKGLSAALNRGFSLARGNFLTWTSADNRYLPNALTKMADFLLCNPCIGLVYANVELINEKGKPEKNSLYRAHDKPVHNSNKLFLPLQATLCICFMTTLLMLAFYIEEKFETL
jgi:glycosyltransferase involved in cell wall biosynthesis